MSKKCSILNCDNNSLAKGLCSKHYYRVKRGGTPEVSFKQQQALRKCSIEGCDNSHFAINFCDKHYRRKERNGDPNFVNPKCNRDGKYKERAYKKSAKWKVDNKDYYNAYLNAQKLRTRRATPTWVNKNELIEIFKNCPPGYHVDHIIPLNNAVISGLNVPWNLQYLTKHDNLSKGNKFDGTRDNRNWRKK